MNTHIVLFIVVGVLGAIFFLPIPNNAFPINKNVAHVVESSEQKIPDIEARAGLARDLITGKTFFEKNSKEVLPLASLTKIISALVAVDHADLNQEIQISQKAVLTLEPSSLTVGEHVRVRDLIAMAMVESSNDAVAALVENFGDEEWFLSLMKEKAESLGVPDMQFSNPIGLDVSQIEAGAYGSADDLITIAGKTLGSPIWNLESVREVKSLEGFIHKLNPTNILDSEITPLIGAKTGYTDLAGGNLLVITEYPLGHPIGIVVLGSSAESRFSDVKNILNWIKTQKSLIK